MTIEFDHMKVKDFPVDLGRSAGPAPDTSDLTADILKLLEKPGRVLCGEVDICIDAKGQWYHQGGKINRQALVNLFSKVLYRDDDGGYWMITPAEAARIKVDDAPFVALELINELQDGEPVIKVRTNVGEIVTLDEDHPIRVDTNPDTGEPRPYIFVRDRLEALVSRSVFYQMVEESDEIEIDGTMVIGVWSQGIFFPLGDTGQAARAGT